MFSLYTLRCKTLALATLLWAVTGAGIRAEPADTSWAESAAALVPKRFVAGAPTRTDLATMTGYLAAFRAGADDPKTPGSAFDWGHSFIVKLEANPAR